MLSILDDWKTCFCFMGLIDTCESMGVFGVGLGSATAPTGKNVSSGDPEEQLYLIMFVAGLLLRYIK